MGIYLNRDMWSLQNTPSQKVHVKGRKSSWQRQPGTLQEEQVIGIVFCFDGSYL